MQLQKCVSFAFYSVHYMLMDGAPICSLARSNLGLNGMKFLCEAHSLSNLKELK